MENSKNICPVCGYAALAEPPYDEQGYPTYVICPCCGFEFGFDDSSREYTFEDYRIKWIEEGYQFFDEEMKPEEWDEVALRKQLENTELVSYTPRL